MYRRRNLIMWIAWTLTMLATTGGCDDRTTRIAREAADRQAQQNTAMADLNKEVAAGTQHLVTADAAARQDILQVHHELQSERTRLDSGWSALETERQRISGQRRMESLLAPVVTFVGGLFLVVVLLGFCWSALAAACRSDDTSSQLNEFLIQDFLEDEFQLTTNCDRPPFLAGPRSPR